jgi:hypothetical protein
LSYYSTIDEDLALAKEILARGKSPHLDRLPESIQPLGYTIDDADIYAAYTLLESFVEMIEAIGPKACVLAVRMERRRRQEERHDQSES